MLYDSCLKKSNQKIQVDALLEARIFAQNGYETTNNNDDDFQEVAQIIPGVYLSDVETVWTPEKLKSHGFTHIIDIDKNLDYNFIIGSNRISNCVDTNNTEYGCGVLPQTMPMDGGDRKSINGMDVLSLNFGESYMTAVLPNCYKAVRFIERALKSGGTILVFEKESYQKCVTIVVGFLMYRYNLKFINAFELIKKRSSYIELDQYYKTQLYEYEPILQVQRTQARGHSCSGELRRACLKRKKTTTEDFDGGTEQQQMYSTIFPLLQQNLIVDKMTMGKMGGKNNTPVVNMEH